jgi:predicted O-methyltransferase YrrM
MQFVKPSEYENKILNRLNNSYLKISEMTEGEREFLNSLILRTKPKKVLEVGVSAGGSSIIMLNALKEIDNSSLYSIDYSTSLTMIRVLTADILLTTIH